MKKLFPLFCWCCLFGMQCNIAPSEPKPWSTQKINNWYRQQPWLVGCNFIPSTAINQLEMWQEETYDPRTIDRELGWAENLGFTSVRVFLHYLVWQQNPADLKKRIDDFLTIASRHKILVMFVLFDDCWNGYPKPGKQPEPKPGIHNSGWVQCPGQAEVTNISLFSTFEEYVKDIISSFRDDQRVVIWDLYNEPGNSDHGNETLPLLTKVFQWARQVKPSQTITAGVWNNEPDFHELNTFQINQSDLISFHCYGTLNDMEMLVDSLRKHGRPLVCTEYMARPESIFQEQLPFLNTERIGAYNWGLVSGKTQTVYPWDSWENPYSKEPEIWFHDIFRGDGTPYDESEVELIRSMTRS